MSGFAHLRGAFSFEAEQKVLKKAQNFPNNSKSEMGDPIKFPKAVSSKPVARFYEFGPFRLDLARRVLLRSGEIVPLAPRLFETLEVLVENRGRLIDKDELMAKLWPDTIVEEANLTVNVSALRRALGDSVGEHKYILTVPARGYRFVAEVKEALEDHSSSEAQRGLRSDEDSEDAAKREQMPRSEKISSRSESAQRELILPVKLKPAEFPRNRRMRRKAAALGLLLIGGVAVIGYSLIAARNRQSKAASGFKLIAVLPFKVVGGSDADEYLGIGMADGLITRLGGIKQIRVRPTNTVLKYAKAEQDPAAAGRELDVDAVLAGSIRKSGDKVRITVQLVSVESGVPVWAEMYDDKISDVFALEDRVSSRAADSLVLNLTREERERVTRQPTGNTEAYDAYVNGRYFLFKGTAEGAKRSMSFFQRAIQIDPSYAQAYAGLADSYVSLGNIRVGASPPSEVMPQAKAAALKALELDDSLAETHAALALIHMRYDWDWPGAEQEFKRALEISPEDAAIHLWHSLYLSGMGRHDDAMKEIQRAKDLDPPSAMTVASSGMICYHARRYDQAISECFKALEMDPNNGLARGYLGGAYEQQGKYKEAINELDQVASTFPDSALQALGHVYAMAGRRGDALKILDRMKERSKQKYYPAYYMAIIYAGLGENERALEWLGKAFAERSGALLYLNVDPRFDRLRLHPGFRNLLRQMKLEG